jgi:hypothetical protein
VLEMPATYRADRDIHRRLRHSAWKGQVDIAKRMIKRGADVEGADGDGFTPLLIASRWGRLDMLKYLVEELKVDLTVTNEEGNSAHNLAVIYHFDEVAEYLASQGCSTTPNGLTLKRQESADAWLAQVMPPTDEEIEKLRDTVESTYSELRQSSSSGGADGPSEAARQVAAISAATGLDEEGAKRNAEEEVVGQQTFPVAQKAVKKAPRHCRLGVGSMGLALFDGVRPVATWPYSLVAEVAVKSVKASGELHVTVTAGKKQKRIVFQTMHAAKLHALIQERRQELSISPPPSAPGSPDPEVAAGAGASEAAGEAAEGGAGGSEGGAVAAAAAAAAAAERAAMPAGPAPPERLDIQPAPAPAPAAEVGRTLWVGGIPDNLLPQLGELSTDYGQQVPPAAARASATPPSTSTGGGGDLQTSALAAKFAAFGTITSLTMRRKLGVNNSWAFVTFTSPEAATAALAAKIEHVDQRGTSCVLQLRTADVEEQVRCRGGCVCAACTLCARVSLALSLSLPPPLPPSVSPGVGEGGLRKCVCACPRVSHAVSVLLSLHPDGTISHFSGVPLETAHAGACMTCCCLWLLARRSCALRQLARSLGSGRSSRRRRQRGWPRCSRGSTRTRTTRRPRRRWPSAWGCEPRSWRTSWRRRSCSRSSRSRCPWWMT